MSVHSQGIKIPKNKLPIPMGGLLNSLSILYLMGMFFGMIITLMIPTMYNPSDQEKNIMEVMQVVYWTIFGLSVLYYVFNALYYFISKTDIPPQPFALMSQHTDRNDIGHELWIWQRNNKISSTFRTSSKTKTYQSWYTNLGEGTPIIRIALNTNTVTLGIVVKGVREGVTFRDFYLSRGKIVPWLSPINNDDVFLQGFLIYTDWMISNKVPPARPVDQINLVYVEQLLDLIKSTYSDSSFGQGTWSKFERTIWSLSAASLLTELETSKEKLSRTQDRCNKLEGVDKKRRLNLASTWKTIERLHCRDSVNGMGKSPKAKSLKLELWEKWRETLKADFPGLDKYQVLDAELEAKQAADKAD